MRRRSGDGGATGLEYAAVILVAAAVVGTLFVVVPNQVTPSVSAALCRLFDGGDGCGGREGEGPGPGPSGSTSPGGPSPSAGPVDPAGLTPEQREYQDALNGLNGADQEMTAAQKEWDAFSLLNELKNIGLDFLFGDIMKCIEKPNIVDCLWAIVGLIPWGKIGKFIKAIPKLAKLADKFLTLKRRLDKARKSRKDAKDRLDRALEACRKKKSGNSFLPGTPVLLADGSHKPIERVRVGDRVWASDPVTGRAGSRPVTALITGTGRKELVEVTIDPDGQFGGPTTKLTSTANHPFWVNGSGPAGAAGTWQEAADLIFGDQLTGPTGATPLVLATRTRTVPAQRVHNLTVADLHTYHVITAGQPILVHNEPPVPTPGEGCDVGNPRPRDLGLSDEATRSLEKLENVKADPLGKINKTTGKNHYDAARREANGDVVARKPDGTPYSHISDLQQARDALMNIKKSLDREAKNLPDTMSERGLEVLLQKQKEVNNLLNSTNGFLSKIGFGGATPPYHSFPPGS